MKEACRGHARALFCSHHIRSPALPSVDAQECYEYIEASGSPQGADMLKLGAFAWLGLALALVETLVSIKFGKGCVGRRGGRGSAVRGWMPGWHAWCGSLCRGCLGGAFTPSHMCPPFHSHDAACSRHPGPRTS